MTRVTRSIAALMPALPKSPKTSRASPVMAAQRVVRWLSFLAWLIVAGCSVQPVVHTSRSTPSILTTEQSQDIAIHALGLVGTRYRYGGNTLVGGFDCSGLIGYVYRTRVGVTPPRTVAQLSGFGQPINTDEIRTGDLVLFGGGRPTHAGIYVGNGRFVHAPSSGGDVRLDRLDGSYWSRQAVEVRRL